MSSLSSAPTRPTSEAVDFTQPAFALSANGRLGEVHGLQVSLEISRTKLASLDRLARTNNHTGPVSIGMPIIHG